MRAIKKLLDSKIALYIPLVLGLIFIIVLVAHFAVNVPSEDQWEMVPLFQKIGNHTITLSSIWHQHNEHRIFFPLLVLLANAYITHWNTVIEMYIGVAVAAFSAILLFRLLEHNIKDKTLALMAGFLTAAWFFSPIQWGNWLWGWQLEWFMCVAAALSALYLLLKLTDTVGSKNRKVLYGLAVISAIIGTYSLASGLLTWAVGLFILIAKKQSRRSILTWITIAVAAIALYYYHYIPVSSPGGSTSSLLMHHPLRFGEFFVAFLGNIVGSVRAGMQAAYIVGSLLLVCLLPLLYITWKRRKNLKLYLPWLAIILYAIICGLATDYGRLGYGINFALNSRYSAFSLLYIIGLIGLSFSLLDNSKKLARETILICSWSIVLVCLPLYISSYAAGIHGFKTQSNYLEVINTCTHLENPTDACLSATYPSPPIVRTRLEYLKARHWAGY